MTLGKLWKKQWLRYQAWSQDKVINSIKDRFAGPSKWALIRMLLLIVFSAVVLLNSILFASPFIGIPSSLGVLLISSLAAGEIFFVNEKRVLKQMLGLATFAVLITLLGILLMLVERFTETVSLVGFVSIGSILGLVSLFGKRTTPHNLPKHEVKAEKSRSRRGLYFIVALFLVSTAVAFYALWLGRTGAGLISVWLTIPSFFFPFFFISSLSLMIALFFTELHPSLKLSFVSLQSFLVHSLFLIVWYPGRNGDPWSHLGEARYIDRVGTFYAYDWLMSQHLFSDIVKYKSQYALVVLFRRMFSLDTYWVQVFFIPLLWSLFAPFFLYKIADLLSTKKSKTFPLLTAIGGGLFTPLVYWGAISVPNSLGFLFLIFTIMLILYGAKSGEKRFWFLAVLTSVIVVFAHPQTGIFAFLFVFAAAVLESKGPSILKMALIIPLPAIYPYFSAYFMNAEFSLSGLLNPSNVESFQLDIFTLLLIFAFLGLVFSLRGKLVHGASALMLFVFYAITAVDYYVVMYGMLNSPVPDRILPLMAILLIPFAALGLSAIANSLRIGFSHVKSNSLTKRLSPRKVAMFLMCVFLSLQSVSVLLQTYPSHEITEQQPAGYAVDAIHYIDSTAPGRYVVLTDPGIASLASGFLGIDYSYGGPEARGTFGVPEWTYWTIRLYSEMGTNPSISILERAMLKAQVGIAYVVVWGLHEDGYFDDKIQRISKVLKPDRIFGDGLLYVYNYTSSFTPINGNGPNVKVTFDDGTSSESQTTFNYFLKSEVTYDVVLTGHSSYNITDYPTYWTFNKVILNDNEIRLDASSDVNSFIYVSGLAPSDTLDVFWKANEHYPRAGWKEDSFKYGWQTHENYTGTISPNITTDGNILSLSWNFSAYYGEYQYYYYTRRVNVETNDYPYILVKWKTTGSVAVIAVAYTDSPGDQYEIVPYSSASSEWTVSIVKLRSDKQLAYITVGLTNLANIDVSDIQDLYVDYILLCAQE
jgi:hypothetical protein